MKKLLIIFQIIIALNSVCQDFETCGTPESTDEEMKQKPWYYDNDYLNIIEGAKEQLINSSIRRKSNLNPSSIINPISIPIRFWFYEDAANNTFIPDDLQRQRLMDRLNSAYQSNGMDVRFYMRCSKFIDDADALSVSPAEASDKFAENYDPTAINVHVVERYDETITGGAYFSKEDFIVVQQRIFTRETLNTLEHEIGHYFTLDHTHRNSDEGKCKQEAINRNTKFTFGQFFTCAKTGKVCEKNGDGLCDTPADPKLNEGNVVFACDYVGTATDEWGDSFNINNVDTRNIMSYSDAKCQKYFSKGQINQMWGNIFFSGLINRYYIYYLNIVDEFMDPDQYEPNNSDFKDVPRIIEVGETQYHSFHGYEDCIDVVDWLRIDNNEVGKFTVEIASVEGFENAVAEVNIYNTDSDGNRAAKYATISNGEGNIIIPCNISTNDFLIEVIKAEDPEDEIVKSIYTITLNAEPDVALSNIDKSEICTSDRFEILNLPPGATVSWSSSSEVALQVYSDQSVTVSNIIASASSYYIKAIIGFNGCQKEIYKTFESANMQSLQIFDIIEIIPTCFPPNSTFDYGIYTTSPLTEVTWSTNFGSIFGSNVGTSASVNPGLGNFTLTATAINSCGNELTISKSFIAEECDCPFGLRFSNINDETIEMEIVNQSANFRSSGTHQVIVTDVNYRIQEQMETSGNICIINTSDYNDGIYFVHTYVDDCFEAGRLVVNKTDNCSNSCPCYANINEAQLSRKTIQVEQKIISNSFNNADVTYIAGESILLETGFETHQYFDFEAKIEDCQ